MATADRQDGPRVCVVGSGTRFLSGISVYTYRLANALARRHRVSAILMRQLLPTRLYPGRTRVGSDLSFLSFDPSVRVHDGVDWYWVPSMWGALRLLVRERPEVIVFQWWSGTVFHSYLLLALAGRLLGGRIVIEFHEVLDTGEANMPVARAYVGVIAPLILRLASAFAVHNSADRALLEQHYDLAGRPVAVLPIGAFDHYRGAEDTEPVRPCPPEVCNLLYFGVIRWYKGLEDLIEAFDGLEPDEVDRYWLTVVGETWEGYDAPAKLIERSRYRDRITFVNRYVSDEEVSGFFAGADAVVLPYRRASTSGPLHIAMGYGLPVLLADVESLNESAEGYGGVVSVPPANPAELTKGLRRVAALEADGFEHPNSWEGTAESYAELFAAALGRPAPPAREMVA